MTLSSTLLSFRSQAGAAISLRSVATVGGLRLIEACEPHLLPILRPGSFVAVVAESEHATPIAHQCEVRPNRVHHFDTRKRPLARLLPPWWLFLITGIGWTIVALILLRSDYTTVRAISILFGIVAIAAGILEVGVTMLAQGWWKLLYARSSGLRLDLLIRPPGR
jgi:hypothetical protein